MQEKKGQGLVEYALILILVSVVVIVVLAVLGEQVALVYCDIAMGLGATGSLPDVCTRVGVQCVVHDISGTQVNLEAVLSDPDGDLTNNTVEFYLDGSLVRVENQEEFCFGGSNTCNTYQNVGAGSHTIRVVAIDDTGTSDPGECTVNVTVP